MPIASIDWLLNASRRFITGSSAPARNNFEKSVIILGSLNQQMKADHEKWMESSVQKKTLHKRPECKWALWISRTRHQCSKCSIQSHQTAQPMRFFLFIVFGSDVYDVHQQAKGARKRGKDTRKWITRGEGDSQKLGYTQWERKGSTITSHCALPCAKTCIQSLALKLLHMPALQKVTHPKRHEKECCANICLLVFALLIMLWRIGQLDAMIFKKGSSLSSYSQIRIWRGQ